MNKSSLDQLQSAIGESSSLLSDLSEIESYSHDETMLRQMPSAVLLAGCTEDIMRAVEFCVSNQIPIVPRGAGSGLSGGCVPCKGSLVISTENMDQMQILPQEKIAICSPGVITKDLTDQAALLGLSYPPDPASYDVSCLGGNVAENAGGLRCKRFGVTKDYVIGLEAITGSGHLIRTGALSQTERGFALGDLLIGSEGTLAIITKIALQLIDLPGHGHTILASFDKPYQAAQAVSEITSSGIVPTVLEFIDGDSLALSNEYEQSLDLTPAGGLLLIETSDINAEEQASRITSICRKNNSVHLQSEVDSVRAEKLWSVRRNIANAAKAAAKIKVSEDVAVPNSKFPAMVAFVAEINQISDLRINTYGHAGDGNLHANLLSTSDSKTSWESINQTVARILHRAISFGGTLTGEHGIGLTKRDFLTLEFDKNTLLFMQGIKDIFDPHQIMNPAKLLPDLD